MQPGKNMMEIIERAYQVFGHYQVPECFDMCVDDDCCVSLEDEQAMYQTPLRELPFSVLNAYNQSARLEKQDADEVRYLLPRLFELIAHGQYPGVSRELALDRIGDADPKSWLPAEYDLLSQFARQHLIDLLNEVEERNQFVLLDNILILFHLAGLDVTPLLDSALEQPGFWAIVSLAFMIFMEREDGQLCNAFSSNRDGQVLNQRINDWILRSRPKLSERATAAIVSPADLTRYYATNYRTMTLGYWVEASLNALQDLSSSI